jgi:hypothetical protein
MSVSAWSISQRIAAVLAAGLKFGSPDYAREMTTTRRVPCERARDETLCRGQLKGWQRHLVAARDESAEKRERSCLQDGWGCRCRLQRAESRRGLRVEVRQDARRRRRAGSRSSSCRRKKREKPGRQTHQRIAQCRSCGGETRSYGGPRSAGPPLATTGDATSSPLSRRGGGCYRHRG